jgi:hypothetical protein
MKFTSILVGVLLTAAGGFAQAANQVLCAGKYQNVANFAIKANLDANNRIVGKIVVAVSGDGFNQSAEMTVRSSDIRPEQWIRFSAYNDTGSGEVTTTFNPSTRKYPGKLKAQGGGSTVEVNVICEIKQVEVFGEPGLVIWEDELFGIEF